MTVFWILFAVALVACACGFKKYIWFISIGYGGAIAMIGLTLLIGFHAYLTTGTVWQCLLFIIYGCRLSGYLAYRELKSNSYNSKMKTEIKSGKDVPFAAKIGIWVAASLLYVCETSPVAWRLWNGKGTDALCVIGLLVSIFGICFESLADFQKNQAKKRNPGRFVDTGLYRIVRCPNYFGELLMWTGVFLSGLNSMRTFGQWLVAILGYVGIIYVMFSGARRLELRQNRTYGKDPVYQQYASTTPILIPFTHLYSVAKYTWLVA